MQLLDRDQAEVIRSASEASKTVIQPVNVARYLNPPPATPFPLEYAFYLLGNIEGKTVLDLGCGSGESLVPLIRRGAKVIGIDISPELITIAHQRLNAEGLSAIVRVGSAYQTELPDSSVEVIFCMSLIHHLDIPQVREEMRRILRPGGFIALKEPIRFSRTYSRFRSLLPAHEDISEEEHPLTEDEFHLFQQGFRVDGLRFFRLPFVPLAQRTFPKAQAQAFHLSNWMVRTFPLTSRYATIAALRLFKPESASPARAA
jgi:ubiquinone/menaquinone biosynthesis C-methylase UbiE